MKKNFSTFLRPPSSPDEWKAACLAWAYFFSVLASYYVLRPIRDEWGVLGGIKNLPWLFVGTLISIVLCNLPFASLTKRLSRPVLMSSVSRFFIFNLIVFAILMHFASSPVSIWIGRAFFIWTSVFNVFVVSLFWMLMVDVFSEEQGKRLFGFIAAGGTFGAICGSALTLVLAQKIPSIWLLLGSALILECSRQIAQKLQKLVGHSKLDRAAKEASLPISGNLLSGFVHTFRSPYLLLMSAYLILSNFTETSLYFQQSEIVKNSVMDSSARIAIFAKIDLWVNGLTLLLQIFLTSWILRTLGVYFTLAIAPVLGLIGFGLLIVSPSLGILMTIQAIRRASAFALEKPAFQVLFTSVEREDKFRAKGFIETVVFRAGDQLGAWTQATFNLMGLGGGAVSLFSLPVCILWWGTVMKLKNWRRR